MVAACVICSKVRVVILDSDLLAQVIRLTGNLCVLITTFVRMRLYPLIPLVGWIEVRSLREPQVVNIGMVDWKGSFSEKTLPSHTFCVASPALCIVRVELAWQ